VASRCGIPAEAIRALAAELRQTPRAVVYGRLGSQASRFGTLASWLVDVLNAVTGHTDVAGGCLFPRPPHHVSRPDRAFATGRHTSRVRGLPEARGELPAATLADEILEPGGVRALVTVAGNPALSVPDSDRVELALASLDLLVCVDPYVNETSRFAHVVLPPEPPLCRPHYDLVFSALSLRTVARWSDATFPLPPGALAEWEILARLVAIASGLPAATPAANVDDFVLGVLVKQLVDDRTSRLHGQDPAAIVRSLGPERGPARMVDALLRAGPFGDGTATGLDLARLRTEPHGLDLGPLEPRGVRVDLLPPALVADLDRLEASLEEPVAEVVLVGRRDVRSNNSWGHNAPHLVRGPDRCTAWVHPDDAEAWGLEAGGAATIASASGEVRAPVEVTDRVRRGVVSLPHGWGHDRPGTRLSVASTRPGVNANRLTDTAVVDPLSGNAELFGVPITVCPG
jgi:anaerobic selenocysteine-containing dehydrogenase